MSKTISKGTLNLKFMQNAQRAKQLQEVELDRAEVQDDGKWEVSQAVRDAWGLGKDTVSHEPVSLAPASAAEPLPPTDGKPVRRPTSISGSRTSGQQSKKSKDSKTARQAIFESGGVGVDLRIQAREAAPTEFLKPAGVDDPKDTKPVLPESPAPAPKDLITGARERKVKREREPPVNDSSVARAKPKKRKKDSE
ncbi:hypothetical protein NLJ89_g4595 [Agrocybe chaxingu]|uniref:Uncharacterized protein n=1 Tax=Agrocybe chaxingu TaxID=84603 RepID=A0A9W8K1T7_9AGAR|nr:hypothetical protein NLJ89_g4595 [Agrocybe chaxingu]